MKNSLCIILLCCLLIFGGCIQKQDVETPSSPEIEQIEIYTKNAIQISGGETPALASGLSFNLLPIDGFNVSPAPTDEYNVIGDFLFVDYVNKEIGIHFLDFMPEEQNIMRKESLSGMGIPYENIHPLLKTLRITDEDRAKFPEYYYIADVPDYAQSYKEEYLQNRIGKEYIPFYYQPILEADFDTFLLWTGWVYAADKNHIYILFRQDIPRKVEGSVADYTVLEQDGIIQYPFYAIIKGAYPAEGNQIDNPFYLVQQGGIWYKGIKLEKANPNAEILHYGPSYFIQTDGVRFHHTKISEADPLTFKVIKEYPSYGYGADARYVYNMADQISKETIKEKRSSYWCMYRTIFKQIKDDESYDNNVLVEVMRENNDMKERYEDERCPFGYEVDF